MRETLAVSTALQTAVLFLVFNRPDNTAQVFEAIRQAKPSRLYVAADGAREGRDGEAECVVKVREIATAVDWPCEIKTLFRDKNLGCKHAVSEAITWFFQQEEQGIILEDDCLPHPDFFAFCENLLFRYSQDERVSVISGSNFQDGQQRGDASYYFSRYNHCWGWATWRRAWRHYQGNLPFWPDWSASATWPQQIPDKAERSYWEKIFGRAREGLIDSWGYSWMASVWYLGGLTATPNVNLVSNIGFGPDATHTISVESSLSKKAVSSLGRLIHPLTVVQNLEADSYTFDNVFCGKLNRPAWSWPLLPRRVAASLYRFINGL